jgi:hypothetical protein
MTTRGAQTITWDVENRPLTVTGVVTAAYSIFGELVILSRYGAALFSDSLW